MNEEAVWPSRTWHRTEPIVTDDPLRSQRRYAGQLCGGKALHDRFGANGTDRTIRVTSERIIQDEPVVCRCTSRVERLGTDPEELPGNVVRLMPRVGSSRVGIGNYRRRHTRRWT